MSVRSHREIRVLHVDDDPDFADLTATYLEREGDQFTVETATSADDGIEIITDHPPDCVVSDYDMPETNGLEFLRAVRDDHPNLPFILYTGKGSEDVASDAISAGATDYLQKTSGTSHYSVLANRIENVVEKYRSQQRLEIQKQQYQRLFEQAPVMYAVTEDDDGQAVITDCNEQFLNRLGYESESVIGEPLASFYTDDSRKALQEEGGYDRALTGEFITEERAFLTADGERIETLLRAVPRVEIDGSTTGTLALYVDITERKQRERELRLKHRAMDKAPAGITITDPDREDNPIVYANERFTDLTGYDEEEVLGRNCRFLQGEATREAPVATMREAIDDEESVTVELQNYRTDGTMFWNEVRISPIRDRDGEVVNFVGFQQDVTERKERERDLREKSNFLEQLFEQVPIHLYVKDTEGRYLHVSEFYVREEYDWIADDTDEILGKTDLEFEEGVGEEAYADDMRVIETGEAIIDKEEYDPQFDNWFLTSKVPWYGPDGEISGLIGVTRRITERKRAEQELERKNERLEEFASFVSHDLRNPLNVAQGRLELARQECDSDHLDFVADAHDRMDALITDLLALAREGYRGDETEAVDLGETVEKCVRNVETGGATVRTETDRTVQCDRAGLEQLLENLVQNAVEHGGADVTITIDDRDGGFFVADDGPGIPETERDRVFERGYSAGEGGTGLGLAIVREVAEAHGWEVSVTESEQGGARFDVTGVEPPE